MEGSDGAIRLVREIVAEEPGQVLLPGPVLEPVQPARPLRRHGRRDPGRGRRSHHALRRRPRHERHDDGHDAPACTKHSRPIHCVAVEPDRSAARPRRAEAHRLAASCRRSTIRTVPDEIVPGHHRGRLGHVRPRRARRGAARRALVGRERLRRGAASPSGSSASKAAGCVVTIACDRGDRYFAPMKWEKRYVW